MQMLETITFSLGVVERHIEFARVLTGQAHRFWIVESETHSLQILFSKAMLDRVWPKRMCRYGNRAACGVLAAIACRAVWRGKNIGVGLGVCRSLSGTKVCLR